MTSRSVLSSISWRSELRPAQTPQHLSARVWTLPCRPANAGGLMQHARICEGVGRRTETLRSAALVPVVEPEDFPQLYHLGSVIRALHLTRLGRIFPERQVRPARIVVALVLTQQAPSVGFVQDDDMVQQLPTYRADDSLRIGILPRTPCCTRHLANPQMGKRGANALGVELVPISVQVSRSTGPGKGLSQLLLRPFFRRMRCHIEVEDSPVSVTHNHKSQQHSKRRSRNDKEVHPRGFRQMQAQEVPPCL
ncbi:hypothetical protein COEX109129_16395 [Corallococcus exiguus]